MTQTDTLTHWWRKYRPNLLSDSRRQSPETQTQIWNWLWQLQHHALVIHCLQMVQCKLLVLMCLPWQNSYSHSSYLMTTPCKRNATYKISKKLPNQNSIHIPLQTWWLVLSQTQLGNYKWLQICPEDGLRRFLHNNMWNNCVMKICVIILGLPKRTRA